MDILVPTLVISLVGPFVAAMMPDLCLAFVKIKVGILSSLLIIVAIVLVVKPVYYLVPVSSRIVLVPSPITFVVLVDSGYHYLIRRLDRILLFFYAHVPIKTTACAKGQQLWH